MRVYTRRPVIDRVFAKVTESSVGCWVFGGALSEGYGKIGLGGRDDGIDFTHRVVWRCLRDDIPEGLDLDHLCRNRACCNPWHLEPVTRKVNVARGLRGPGYTAASERARRAS